MTTELERVILGLNALAYHSRAEGRLRFQRWRLRRLASALQMFIRWFEKELQNASGSSR